MSHDDPKITAYALGELEEALELDEQALKAVEETALVASVLRRHFRRPRRRLPTVRYALAALLLIALGSVAVLVSVPSPQPARIVKVDQPVEVAAENVTPTFVLTPAVTQSEPASSLAHVNFRGIHAVDVEQLVAVVFADASRVGAFTSLKLMPESSLAFQ